MYYLHFKYTKKTKICVKNIRTQTSGIGTPRYRRLGLQRQRPPHLMSFVKELKWSS